MNNANSTTDLTIALPAYEEAGNLVNLLPQLRQTLDQLKITYEILVVDTETPRDATPTVCAKWNAQYIPRSGGSLYSHAIRTAQKNAKGQWVVFMDADGSHNPAFVGKLWTERDNADLVIASRYVRGGHTDNPALLVFMSLAVNYVFRIVLGLRCADVSNSFRLYKGDDLRSLELECENFDIVEEILVKLSAIRNDYKIKEIPFSFEKRKEGKTKRNLLTFMLSYVKTLMRLRSLQNKIKNNKK